MSKWGEAMARENRPALAFTGNTRKEFVSWQKKFEAKYRELLGRFPDQVPLRPRILERCEFPDYVREKVVFDSERFMSVPAWVCTPHPRKRGQKFPVVVCCHGHGHGGKGLVGLDAHGKPRMDYQMNLGARLAQTGYVTISPDWRCFGERNEPPETSPAPRDLCNVGGLVSEFFGYHLLTLDLWDGMKALDYLGTRKEADLTRVGCFGVSFGGTMTLFLTAADTRISAACVSGYLAPTAGTFPGWGVCGSQTLPGLLQWGDRAEVAGLICPRPLLVQVGEYDSSFPAAEALAEYRRVEQIYRAAGCADRLDVDLFEGSHAIHAAPIIKWFDRWLKNGA